MPSKKRKTRVRFNYASRAADQQSRSGNTTRPASTRSNLPNNSRTANQTTQNSSTSREVSTPLNTTPTSPTHSSNASTPLTPSPHVPTFEYIVSKKFNKSLIASLTSKDAVLKEVRDCILTNNESRLKAIPTYTHIGGTSTCVPGAFAWTNEWLCRACYAKRSLMTFIQATRVPGV